MAKGPPPYKIVIREAIMAFLFNKMVTLANQELVYVIRKNSKLMGYHHQSFAYNGTFYSQDDTEGPPVRQRLHPDMVPDMRRYLDEFGHPLSVEKARVSGYISSVLAYSPLPGDHLLLLPTLLHPVVKEAVNCDWSTSLSPEKIASFQAKYEDGYNTVRQRLALNLIL